MTIDFWYGVGLGFCGIEVIFVLGWLVYCFYGPKKSSKRVKTQSSVQQKSMKENKPEDGYDLWDVNDPNVKHLQIGEAKAGYQQGNKNKPVAEHKSSARELPLIDQKPLARNAQSKQLVLEDDKKKYVGAKRQKDHDPDTITIDLQEKEHLVKGEKSKHKIEGSKRRSEPDTIGTLDENLPKSLVFD
ncbi:hypothetical protein M3Y95_00339100 [Aphelenchoides besseyi]|nr:hypothetical protein M3Y95_00339100 [Aphelenchoides besseyi]